MPQGTVVGVRKWRTNVSVALLTAVKFLISAARYSAIFKFFVSLSS